MASFFFADIKNDTRVLCLKVILAWGIAVMVALPGTINFDLNKGVHATGVFAVFCIIFFFGVPNKSNIEMYSVVGNLKFLDGTKEMTAPYEGITFTITPPRSAIENTGYFHIENIPVDKDDETSPVILTINKKGFTSLGITIDENLPEKLRKFDIKREGNKFFINGDDFVYLKKDPNDLYWGIPNVPVYNASAAQPVAQPMDSL
jgi:hypothetical protein